MSTKTKAPLSFAALPRDYPALCRLHLPRPIHDKADYDNTVEIADALAGFEDAMSTDQTDYFDLLYNLIEVYEEEHVKWPKKRTALQRLQYLLDEHNLNGATSRASSARRATSATPFCAANARSPPITPVSV